MKNILKLFLFIGIVELVGIIGSVFTSSSVNGWYQTLIRPDLAPPDWVFAPVWTTLFALMGISVFLIWEKSVSNKGARFALFVFACQLLLNLLWSMIFFGLQSPGWALLEIGILWIAITTTILLFHKISRLASLLLIPYILWVTFAVYLNYLFWILN